MTTRNTLAIEAAMNPHGRASTLFTPVEGVYTRTGFVMATVKDANDSVGFKPIESFDFAYEQGWFAMTNLLNQYSRGTR